VAKEIIQHAIIRVVQRPVVRYTCDRCGKVCGTRENPKTTWYVARWHAKKVAPERHYCLRTCHPSAHPRWERDHVLNCELCYAEAEAKGETWMDEAVLRALRGER
jgi:hypothetical protein